MYKLLVNLPSLVFDQEQADLAEEVARVRVAGLDLCIQFDWHMPGHSRPPHLSALEAGARVPDSGLGYAPFGWVRGWVWAREEMQKVINAFLPDAVMYGDHPHIRHGWGFLNDQREPDVAAYNDTLGILRQSIYGEPREDFPPAEHQVFPIIVPETPGSNVQKRGLQRIAEQFPVNRGYAERLIDFEDLPENGSSEALDLLEEIGVEIGVDEVSLEEYYPEVFEELREEEGEHPIWKEMRRAERHLTIIWDAYPVLPLQSRIKAARRRLKRALRFV